MTDKTISAAAISRILSRADIRKATTTGWSRGFTVIGYGVCVEVIYSDDNPDKVEENLDAIVRLINGRPDRKYFAKREIDRYKDRKSVV